MEDFIGDDAEPYGQCQSAENRAGNLIQFKRRRRAHPRLQLENDLGLGLKTLPIFIAPQHKHR
jgi:hypothetical protein